MEIQFGFKPVSSRLGESYKASQEHTPFYIEAVEYCVKFVEAFN